MTSQRGLAHIVSADSPFALALQKRLTVLMRIYHGISVKYHCKSVNQTELNNSLDQLQGNKRSSVYQKSGNDALIETAVKTGLCLIFSLLRQNLALNTMAPEIGLSSLCNDVLITASDVMQNLPMLSLSNESKLSKLSLSSLEQVTAFLVGVTTGTSGK